MPSNLKISLSREIDPPPSQLSLKIRKFKNFFKNIKVHYKAWKFLKKHPAKGNQPWQQMLRELHSSIGLPKDYKPKFAPDPQFEAHYEFDDEDGHKTGYIYLTTTNAKE